MWVNFTESLAPSIDNVISNKNVSREMLADNVDYKNNPLL